MKICPNCLILHDKPLTFCSRSCANRRNHSKETRKKISNSVRKYHYVKRNCIVCNNEFEVLNSSSKKTCCQKCAIELTAIKVRGTRHTVKDSSKMGGIRYNGGRCNLIEYENIFNEIMFLNADEIEIAKVLDSLNIKWKRNNIGFKYIDDVGKPRKFYPDFYIEENNLFLEYKGWITEKMIHKMKDAIKRNAIKLKVVYSNDKRYKDMGLNLTDFKNNPLLLFK